MCSTKAIVKKGPFTITSVSYLKVQFNLGFYGSCLFDCLPFLQLHLRSVSIWTVFNGDKQLFK